MSKHTNNSARDAKQHCAQWSVAQGDLKRRANAEQATAALCRQAISEDHYLIWHPMPLASS